MMVLLEKGGSVDLTKSTNEYCVGVNWGSIVTGGSWFSKKQVQSVDLDLSLGLFDNNNELVETVYYAHKHSPGVKHFGDDLTGDDDGIDDGLDNETISIDLNNLLPKVTKVAFVINSFDGTKFGKIPYIGIRIYEGTPTSVGTVCAQFKSESFSNNSKSAVLATLVKTGKGWTFTAVNEESSNSKLNEVLVTASHVLKGE